MLIVEGTFTVEPAVVAKALPAVMTLVQATRSEDGCIDYHFSEEIGSPGTIRVFERWTDRAALEKHLQTQHVAQWNKAAEQFDIVRRTLVTYEGVAEPVDLLV